MIIIKVISAIVLILLGLIFMCIAALYTNLLLKPILWISKKVTHNKASKLRINIWVTICLIIKAPNDLFLWISDNSFAFSNKISRYKRNKGKGDKQSN